MNLLEASLPGESTKEVSIELSSCRAASVVEEGVSVPSTLTGDQSRNASAVAIDSGHFKVDPCLAFPSPRLLKFLDSWRR